MMKCLLHYLTYIVMVHFKIICCTVFLDITFSDFKISIFIHIICVIFVINIFNIKVKAINYAK